MRNGERKYDIGGRVMRRRFIELVLIATLAVVLNVGTAWACVIWSKHPRLMERVTLGETPLVIPEHWPQSDRASSSSAFGYLRWSYSAFEHFAMFVPAGQSPDYVIQLNHAGWPLRSMAYCFGHTPEGPIREGLQIPASDEWQTANAWRRLPTRARPAAFVANSTIYFLALGTLFWGPRLLVRMRRSHRGQCLNCGYDLAGLKACPECNWAPRSPGPGE